MNSSNVRIGEILGLQRRAVTPDPTSEYREIGVRSFGKGVFHKDPVFGSDLGNKRVFEIRPGDLVMSNVFAWEGAVAVAGEEERGTIGSHRFMTYTPVGQEVSVSWLRYFFLCDRGLGLIRQASPGSAGRNRTLAIDRFEELEISLPSLAEQRRVADWLTSLVSTVRRLERSFSTIDEKHILSSLPSLFDRAISRYAKGNVKVEEVAEIVSDTVHPGDELGEARRFVGLQHVESHTGRALGSLPIGNEKGRKFRFRPGDVVYGYLRPYLNKVWVADHHGLCSVDQYVLRPKGGIRPTILAFLLRSAHALTQAVRLTHNLQLPRLRSRLLLELEVFALEARGQRQVLRELEQLTEHFVLIADLRRRQQRLLQGLEKAILNQAFAGLQR